MNKLIKGIAAVCLSACACFAFSACGSKDIGGDSVEPDNSEYSIVTKLNLKLGFEDDVAKAEVKNTFTLFPAKATVYAYLYYSETEANGYSEMTEVANVYTEDLDQGETLTASWDTSGRGGYFLARMRYKIDSREWEERVTEIYEREYTKVILEPIADNGSLPVFKDIVPFCPYLIEDHNNEFIYDNNGFELFDRRHFFYLGSSSDDMTCEKFEDQNIKGVINSINKEFYILNPVKSDYLSHMNYIQYSIYKNEDDYILDKYMLLAVPEFGLAHPTEPGLLTGRGDWNLSLSLNFINIEKLDCKGKLRIEFGKDDDKSRFASGFINLYLSNDCIGTCYYKSDTVKEITYAFFYNLFAEGLSII